MGIDWKVQGFMIIHDIRRVIKREVTAFSLYFCKQFIPIVFLNNDISDSNTTIYLAYISLYLVAVGYMFQPHVVFIRLATRQKIITQLFKTLYST